MLFADAAPQKRSGIFFGSKAEQLSKNLFGCKVLAKIAFCFFADSSIFEQSEKQQPDAVSEYSITL